ncbi:MAG: YibE/F family protein [Synergistaceae bacterium]|nr:YibE/F family protein [Synergistaceae bacterium]
MRKKNASVLFMVYLFRVATAVLIASVVYSGADYYTLKFWNTQDSHVVRILDIGQTIRESPSEEEDEPFKTEKTELTVQSLTGKKRGQSFRLVATQMEGGGVKFERGHRYILVSDVFEDGSALYSIADAYRVSSVVWVIVLACGVLIAIAGRSGLRALLGLGLSIVVLMWGYIPLVATGSPPVPLAFLAVFLISVFTVLCVVKRRQTRLVALLGTLGGAAGGFGAGWLMVMFWHLTGLSGENASLLFTTIPGIDIQGILLSSIIISAIGAVLDVGISITAAMSELVEYDPEISLTHLWASGIRVGGEVLGSMINTLILAYLGTALPMTLLISNAGPDLIGLLNDPYVGQEIVHSLAGTLGLLLTIPATATFFVFREKLRSRRSWPEGRLNSDGGSFEESDLDDDP